MTAEPPASTPPASNLPEANPPASETLASGPLLNHRYRIVRSLAEGSFGKTYLAEDSQMPSRRRCVIKQLKPVSGNPAVANVVQQRFLREVAVLDVVGKTHPQIPTLYAYFTQAGQFYLVQEWIDGTPLLSMPQAVWAEENVLALLKSVLPVLSHVHGQNVIHRDIKPGNIILNRADSLPYLIDFGSVKELMSTVIESGGEIKSSIVIGTPGFMSPEQAAGRPTFSSDLYSLGMTAIYLLTGRSPGEIPTHSHTGQLVWRQYAPSVGDTLAKVISCAVSTNYQLRYVTAQDMSAALSLHSISIPCPVTIAPPGMSASTTTLQSAQTVMQSSKRLPDKSNLLGKLSVKKRVIVAGAVLVGIGVLFTFFNAVSRRWAQRQLAARTEAQTTMTPVKPSTTAEASSRLDKQVAASAKTSSVGTVSASAYQQQAVELYQQNREPQALEKIEAALSIQSNLIEALILKGDILANQTIPDVPEAIALYTQALATIPEDVTLLGKRCKAYMSLKKWTLASADCTQALDLDPSNAALFGRRGNIYSAQANYEAAVQDYSEAIALNAANGQELKNQSFYYRRAEALGKLERYEEAMGDFEKMRSLTP